MRYIYTTVYSLDINSNSRKQVPFVYKKITSTAFFFMQYGNKYINTKSSI